MSKKRKKEPLSFRQRQYREIPAGEGLCACQVKVRETDLQVMAPFDVADPATHLVIEARNVLENYIAGHRDFLESLVPLDRDQFAPPLVRGMLAAAETVGVGPMAAVAGAIAEHVGRGLLELDGCDEVVVENGGDVFICRNKDCTATIYAGTSPLSCRVGVKLPLAGMPLGVCTSSGTVGHSLSLGKADSVTAIASSTLLADAAATGLGNIVGGRGGLAAALEKAAEIPGLTGVVIIAGAELGAWGEIELVTT